VTVRPPPLGAPEAPGPALTARGKVLAGVAVALALGAWLFGLQELYCLAAAAAVTVSGARAWVRWRPWALAVTRVVHPTRVAAGQEARVELVVTNPRGRPSPSVKAADPFEGGRRWARFSIAPLGPGETRRSSYRLPSSRRGIYTLGPLELRLTDPFGLAEAVRVVPTRTSLTVHPAYELVPIGGMSSHREEDRRPHRPRIGRGGSEFYTLREYVPGDDLRHVHWPSTARLDDLVIRQPDNLRRGRLTVAADLRAGVVDDETLEGVISAAASLAVSALRSGSQVRVVTTAGWDSGHGSGEGHAAQVLDGLAAAGPHRARAGLLPPRRAAGREPVVVVTTTRATRADLNALVAAHGGLVSTMVVFEPTPGSPDPAPSGPARGPVRRRPPEGASRSARAASAALARSAGGQRVVSVGPSGSFAEAWTRVFAAEVN
jgi:uncharacterized protein (DUF58 family)